MVRKVEGIIIKEMAYQESSKILTVLTRDLGKISLIAQGSKKVKSTLRSGTQQFVHGIFYIYYKEKSLSTVSTIDIITNFSNIKKDLNKSAYAQTIVELTDYLCKDNPDQSSLFEMLIDTLNLIEQGLDEEALSLIFELKALGFLGVKPSVDQCSVCFSTEEIVSISAHHGGYICRHCVDSYTRNVTEKTVKVFRLLYYVDLKSLNKLSLHPKTKHEIRQFIDEYYDKYTGIFLKSKLFIKQIHSIL